MIPKQIFLSWKTKDLVNNPSYIIQNGLKKLIELNPDWTVTVYDDQEVDDYLKANIPPQAYEDIKDKHIVEKSDLWRLVKLHNEGGVYVDIDRLCNVPMNEIVDNDDLMWVLPTCADHDFSHDIMITAPGNPAFLEAARLNVVRRHQGARLYDLGAPTYMHAITGTMLGEQFDQSPGEEKFKQIRDMIASMPFIKTYREDPPCNTILYKGDLSREDHEKYKREFYASCGMKHWTNEW